MDAEVNAILDQARSYLVDQFQDQSFAVKEKTPLDIVTQADLDVEKMICDQLKTHFPNIAIMSEESVQSHGLLLEKPTWILDPLDGTINFSRGFGLFCISLALVEKNQVIKGWIDVPLFDLRYRCEKGKGSFCNQKPIFVSKTKQSQKAMIVMAQPPLGEKELAQNLSPRVSPLFQSFRRTGSAVFNFTQVAQGSFDVFYGSDLKPWDVAAGILLVSEAGGRITQFDGTDTKDVDQKEFLVSNGLLHPLI